MTDPDYLVPYLKAAARYGEGFGTLLWASPRSQAARFAAQVRGCDPYGKTVVDAGCGRADFLEYLMARGRFPRHYTGIEAVPDMAAVAVKKQSAGAKIITGDFVTQPQLIPAGVQVIYYSGSLNTLPDDSFYQCLTIPAAAATEAVVFNFLSSAALAASPHLFWRKTARVEKQIRPLGKKIRVIDDYLPGDTTIVISKDVP